MFPVDVLKYEADPADKFNAPAEVRANVPDVKVEIERFPDVLAQDDVPPDVNPKVVAEVPMVPGFVQSLPSKRSELKEYGEAVN
jgi:hypothetical protein